MKSNSKGVTGILTAIIVVLGIIVGILALNTGAFSQMVRGGQGYYDSGSRISFNEISAVLDGKVTGRFIQDEEIRSRHLVPNSITSTKILDNSIRTDDVAFSYALSDKKGGDAVNALKLGGHDADEYQRKLIGTCGKNELLIGFKNDGSLLCDEIELDEDFIGNEGVAKNHIEDRAIDSSKLDYDENSLGKVTNRKMTVTSGGVRVNGDLSFSANAATWESNEFIVSAAEADDMKIADLGSRSFCSLSKYQIEGDGSGYCEVTFSSGTWKLNYAKTGNTAVHCKAVCIS